MAEDKCIEEIVGLNLERYFSYIQRNLYWKDLVIYYPRYSNDQRHDIITKGKTDHAEAMQMALEIIMKSEHPDRFTDFVKAVEDAGFSKISGILRGIRAPTTTSHRQILDVCSKYIYESLNPEDLLDTLVANEILRDSDAQIIRTRARMDGRNEAVIDFLHILPRRHRMWFSSFVEALKINKYADLANLLEGKASLEVDVKCKDAASVNTIIRTLDLTPSSPECTVPVPQNPDSPTKQTPSVPCTRTDCRRREFYCSDHTCTYCSDCSPADHEHCNVVEFTFYMRASRNPKFNNIRSYDVDNLCRYLHAFIQARENYCERLDDQVGECVETVKEETVRIVEELQRIEKSKINEVIEQRNGLTLRVQSEIEVCKEQLDRIKRVYTDTESAVHEMSTNDRERAVLLIELNRTVDQCYEVLNKMDNQPGAVRVVMGRLLDELTTGYSTLCDVEYDYPMTI